MICKTKERQIICLSQVLYHPSGKGELNSHVLSASSVTVSPRFSFHLLCFLQCVGKKKPRALLCYVLLLLHIPVSSMWAVLSQTLEAAASSLVTLPGCSHHCWTGAVMHSKSTRQTAMCSLSFSHSALLLPTSSWRYSREQPEKRNSLFRAVLV